MNLRALFALVRKDLRVLAQDRHALVLSFAAPIALASFMAAIFGGAGASSPSRIPLVLVDEDGSKVTQSIVRGAETHPSLAVEVRPKAEAEAIVRRGESALAVVLPAGFGTRSADAIVGDGPSPELTVILDPTKRPDVRLAQGLLTRIILESVSAEALGDLGGGWLDDVGGGPKPQAAPRDDAVDRADFLSLFRGADPEEDRKALADAFPGLKELVDGTGPLPESPKAPPRKAGLQMPYEAREVSITPGGPEGERGALAAHAFAGMVVQFVLFSAVEWGVGLLNERKKGLWKRLRVAPVSRGTLLLSKILGCWINSLLIVAVVLGSGALMFGYRVEGSWIALIGLALAFAWMAATFGLMVAALGRSPQGARSVSILATLVLVLLGGCWIPGFLFPEWLNRATVVIPTRWAIDGLDGVLSRGLTLADTTPNILALLAFGAGFGAVALAGSSAET